VIRNNIVDGASEGAVVGYRWNDRVGGPIADGETGFAHLTLSGNRAGGGGP
jgi:hypothetical protein